MIEQSPAPVSLHHGTTIDHLESILTHGLKPQPQRWPGLNVVCLGSLETANICALNQAVKRNSEPIVLRVDFHELDQTKLTADLDALSLMKPEDVLRPRDYFGFCYCMQQCPDEKPDEVMRQIFLRDMAHYLSRWQQTLFLSQQSQDGKPGLVSSVVYRRSIPFEQLAIETTYTELDQPAA